jgi:hypothetical protein
MGTQTVAKLTEEVEALGIPTPDCRILMQWSVQVDAHVAKSPSQMLEVAAVQAIFAASLDWVLEKTFCRLALTRDLFHACS